VDVRIQAAEHIVVDQHGGTNLELSTTDQTRLFTVAKGVAHDLALRGVQRRKGRYQNAFHIYYAFAPLGQLAELYSRWENLGLEFGHPFAMNTKWFSLGQYASLHFLMNYFDRSDTADRRRIATLCEHLDRAALELGAVGKVKAETEHLKSLAVAPLYARVRDAVDPNGVLQWHSPVNLPS
jgi:hypothetical protein